MIECKHELPLDTCFDCRPREKGPVWPAKFDAVCPVPTCPSPVIDAGMEVCWTRDGTKIQHAHHQP